MRLTGFFGWGLNSHAAILERRISFLFSLQLANRAASELFSSYSSPAAKPVFFDDSIQALGEHSRTDLVKVCACFLELRDRLPTNASEMTTFAVTSVSSRCC
jgi:hypothetical protein